MEAEFFPLGRPVDRAGLIEARVEDHPGSLKNCAIFMPERAGLLDGMVGSTDNVLRPALDPEMLRIVREVGQDRDKGPPRISPLKTFLQSPIKVRHQRYHHVRRMLLP